MNVKKGDNMDANIIILITVCIAMLAGLLHGIFNFVQFFLVLGVAYLMLR